MMQSWENDKKLYFRTQLSPLPWSFFHGFYLWQCSKLSSYAVSRKTKEPSLKKRQKELILGPILVHIAQMWDPESFLRVLSQLVVVVVPSYHPMQLKGKLMNQIWELAKNIIWGLNLARFGHNLVFKVFFMGLSLLDVIHCCRLSFNTASRKTNEPNLKK